MSTNLDCMDVEMRAGCDLCFVIEMAKTFRERGSCSWVWVGAPPAHLCCWCWRRARWSALLTVGVPAEPTCNPGMALAVCDKCREAIDTETRKATSSFDSDSGVRPVLDPAGMIGIIEGATTKRFKYWRHFFSANLRRRLRVVEHCEIEDLFPDGVPDEIRDAIASLEQLDRTTTVADLIEE